MRNSMSAVGRELSGGEAAKRARNRVALHFKFLHPPTQRLNLRTCSGQLGTEVAFLAEEDAEDAVALARALAAYGPQIRQVRQRSVHGLHSREERPVRRSVPGLDVRR